MSTEWAEQHRALSVPEFRTIGSAIITGVCEIWCEERKKKTKIADGLLVKVTRHNTRVRFVGVYFDEASKEFKAVPLRGEVKW